MCIFRGRICNGKRPGSVKLLKFALGLRQAICHGPQGVSDANSPNLAGQYAAVTFKELNDFKTGARVNAVEAAG